MAAAPQQRSRHEAARPLCVIVIVIVRIGIMVRVFVVYVEITISLDLESPFVTVLGKLDFQLELRVEEVDLKAVIVRLDLRTEIADRVDCDRSVLSNRVGHGHRRCIAQSPFPLADANKISKRAVESLLVFTAKTKAEAGHRPIVGNFDCDLNVETHVEAVVWNSILTSASTPFSLVSCSASPTVNSIASGPSTSTISTVGFPFSSMPTT